MKLVVLLLSLLSFVLLIESRPGSLLHDRHFDDDEGVAIDRVPKRRSDFSADKMAMLETNKLPRLSKYFSMHEW